MKKLTIEEETLTTGEAESAVRFMAATAILTEPDFFKVAVSRAGNHDNNLYWHHWNERYGAVTEKNDGAGRTRFLSRSATNNEVAANLKGRLLLVQGTWAGTYPCRRRYASPTPSSRRVNASTCLSCPGAITSSARTGST